MLNKRELSKKANAMKDVQESIDYLTTNKEEYSGIALAIVEKHLGYALLKKEELCKSTENTLSTK